MKCGDGDEPTSLHVHKNKINVETRTANYYFKLMILVNSFSIIPQYFFLVKMETSRFVTYPHIVIAVFK